MKGISALIKGTTWLPHLCHHVRLQESDSQQTESFSTLTWTFPASKTMREKLLLFLSHQALVSCESSLDRHSPRN